MADGQGRGRAARAVRGVLRLAAAGARLLARPRAGARPGPDWARADDPDRDRRDSTALVLRAVDAGPGMRILDRGAGAGYLSLKLAALVGPGGQVVATDTDRRLVRDLAALARARGLDQIVARRVRADELGVAPGWADAILMVDVGLRRTRSPARALARLGALRRGLRPGGRVVIFQHRTRPHHLDLDALTGLAAAAGLAVLSCQAYRAPPSPEEPLGRPGYLAVLGRGPA